jgi:hypothetical protein
LIANARQRSTWSPKAWRLCTKSRKNEGVSANVLRATKETPFSDRRKRRSPLSRLRTLGGSQDDNAVRCKLKYFQTFAGSPDIAAAIRDQDFRPRFFNLTPGAPPLMNSMPAPSRARFSAVIVELWATKTPGFDSRRFIVGRETDEAFAKWRCSQRKRALAARISSLVSKISFMLTIPVALFDT